MTAKREQASDLDAAVVAILDTKQKGNDTGSYHRLAENVLGRWYERFQQRGITDLNRIDTQTMCRYAQQQCGLNPLATRQSNGIR